MTKRSFLLAAFAVAILAAAPQAVAAKPNFSGDWKMNVEKSDWGPIPSAPESLTRKIEHTDAEIKMTTTQKGPQGERTTSTTWKTDGSEQTVKMGNAEVKGTAKWDGDVLVISSKREANGMEIGQTERYVLSSDGKTINITNAINAAGQEFEVKLVLEKQ
ncbi:MAG: hypothetical protein K2X35_23440 [Bryobacteraceae bacterium]|nr:hypothetical protein [Bryobacteraceae bacterium]